MLGIRPLFWCLSTVYKRKVSGASGCIKSEVSRSGKPWRRGGRQERRGEAILGRRRRRGRPEMMMLMTQGG